MGPFGVDVDQPHLDSRQGLVQGSIGGVAFIAEPGGFLAPEHILFGLPDVGATSGKAQGAEAHRLQRFGAGKNDQIGPGDGRAVTALEGPQQPPGLVEVGVVGPAVEGRKALVAMAGTTAAIPYPVGAGAVPGQANEQGSVMAPVRRPPVLGIGHQRP